MVGAGAVMAQSYYDDDIYYDPAKAKKEQKQQTPRQTQTQSTRPAVSGQYYYDGAGYVPWDNVGDFQSADSYVPVAGSTRDVDEYNRHAPATDKAQGDSITLEQFEALAAGNMANTRNLARFHGSEVAQEAYQDDDQYADAYNNGYNEGYTAAAGQPDTSLTINVSTGWPWYGYSSWYRPWGWYGNPWYYSSWYDPWYWSFGWSSPGWSWAWGPSWGWGYPGAWGWGYPGGWGWSGPSWAWAPRYYNNPTGATRPNRPGAGNSYYGNAANGGRPGYRGRNTIANSNGRRPSTGVATGTHTSRPGYQSPVGRPTTAGSVNSSYQRGREGYNRQPATPSRTPSYNNNSNSNRYNSNQSNGSYNRGRSGGFSTGGSSRGSGGGFSGGSSRGGGYSGGGGHRGR